MLSVTDYAGNGFFHWMEWIPVVSSALAVSFLLVPFFCRVDALYLRACAAVMLLQAGVAGLFVACQRGPARSLAKPFRKRSEWRSADGAASLSESGSARTDCFVGLWTAHGSRAPGRLLTPNVNTKFGEMEVSWLVYR